ncbi:UxaA family hydrolase [Neobacillus cucumis]|nr:UxaA family hydrolase [Neobacillus cucumis]
MTEYSFESNSSCIVMSSKDNVATLLRNVKQGESISIIVAGISRTILMKEDVKFGHKVAIEPILNGEYIVKYGESIGAANQLIEPGEHVHIHNLEGIRGRGDNHFEKEVGNLWHSSKAIVDQTEK